MIDTHAHYGNEVFDPDRDAVLEACRKAGVEAVVNISFSRRANVRESMEHMFRSLHKYPWIYFAVGIHPTCLKENDPDWILMMKEMAARKNVVAIGETGLDYYYDNSSQTKELQKYWFRKHLEIAEELSLPVILHMRDADLDGIRILREYPLGHLGVVHCFSEGWATAQEYLDMGLYFGIGGKVTRRENTDLRDAVQKMPIEKLLLETDAPFVRPVGCTAKRNTSCELSKVIQAIAELRNLSETEVIQITSENAKRLFQFYV